MRVVQQLCVLAVAFVVGALCGLRAYAHTVHACRSARGCWYPDRPWTFHDEARAVSFERYQALNQGAKIECVNVCVVCVFCWPCDFSRIREGVWM